MKPLTEFFQTMRAWVRLAGFLAITAVTVVRLKFLKLRASVTPHAVTRIGHGWARLLIRLLGVQMEVHGTVPAGAPLLVANHRSYVDIAALLSQIPCVFLAKEEIGTWPVLGTAAKLHHTVFVNREDKTSRRGVRAQVSGYLRQGVPFAAFPEGTTSRGPGTLPFCPGLFQEAAAHGFDVVPVAIEYGERSDAWVDDDDFLTHFLSCFRKKRVNVSVRFGPVLRELEAIKMKSYSEGWIRENLNPPAGESREFPEGDPLPDLLPA